MPFSRVTGLSGTAFIFFSGICVVPYGNLYVSVFLFLLLLLLHFKSFVTILYIILFLCKADFLSFLISLIVGVKLELLLLIITKVVSYDLCLIFISIQSHTCCYFHFTFMVCWCFCCWSLSYNVPYAFIYAFIDYHYSSLLFFLLLLLTHCWAYLLSWVLSARLLHSTTTIFIFHTYFLIFLIFKFTCLLNSFVSLFVSNCYNDLSFDFQLFYL